MIGRRDDVAMTDQRVDGETTDQKVARKMRGPRVVAEMIDLKAAMRPRRHLVKTMIKEKRQLARRRVRRSGGDHLVLLVLTRIRRRKRRLRVRKTSPRKYRSQTPC